jgi:hypothetical protein
MTSPRINRAKTNPKLKSTFSKETNEDEEEEKKSSTSSTDSIFEGLKQSEQEVQQYIELHSPFTPMTL